jgi:dihydroorotate dehydrogenase
MLYRRAVRPLLFARDRDPETVHGEVLRLLAGISRSPALTRALALVGGGLVGAARDPRLERQVFGLRFPNPIGLAAGFDKNGVAAPALAALGFGFVEIGTVTRLPQAGNPRPRLFRLPADGALINRMGFNNAGAAAVAAQLARLPRPGVPLGVSLGKSRATPLEEAEGDYLSALELLYPYADYFAINVSSPNTPGLRALQERARLDALLAALTGRLGALEAAEGRTRGRPLLVKVSPDLEGAALTDVVEVCLARGVDGLIATNTTLGREGLSASVTQEGGLSGRPLHARAVGAVGRLRALAGERLPIVGCGGVSTPDDAMRMLDAGATLLQLYTGFIYEGPGLAPRLARALAVGKPARSSIPHN